MTRHPLHPRAAISVPVVYEEEGGMRQQFDLFSRLLKDRIIMLGTEVDDMVADYLIGELLYLQSVDPKKDIHLYINSPGGSVTAGLAIYDTIQMVSCDVCTYCLGQAASMGAVLLAAGAHGKRFALPNARIMIHQPWGGMQGTASDISIQAKEILRLKERLTEILADHTGKEYKTIEADTERDFFMSSSEAVAYGIVDDVLSPKKAKNTASDKKK